MVFITMEEPLNIRILDVNAHIVCSLCAGYFIDATTITECLHTFCKSCIIKYLQSSKLCPQCGTKIHETQPTLNLKPDRVMQDILFKLIPNLYESEEKRKQEFYKARGLAEQKQEEPVAQTLTSIYEHPEAHYYRNDELLCMCLEKYSQGPNENIHPLLPLPKKFVRCSVRTQIRDVIKLLNKKLCVPQSIQVELLCSNKVLQTFMTLKQVYLSQWVDRPSPMMIYYRLHKSDS